MAGKTKQRYRILVGMNYGPHGRIRFEIGDVTEDLPASDVPWLIEQGYIEPHGAEVVEVVSSDVTSVAATHGED